jgi:hypothetical protein
VRIGNLSDRLILVTDQGAIDVEKSSAGRFGADPQAVYERWHEAAMPFIVVTRLRLREPSGPARPGRSAA